VVLFVRERGGGGGGGGALVQTIFSSFPVERERERSERHAGLRWSGARCVFFVCFASASSLVVSVS
jgi:hypothetical protein